MGPIKRKAAELGLVSSAEKPQRDLAGSEIGAEASAGDGQAEMTYMDICHGTRT